MANELRIGIVLGFLKSGATLNRSFNKEITVTGDAFTHGVQEVGTSEEELAQGAEVGTPGYVLVINLDSTNYVEIGSTTGVYDIKLLAGEAALYRHNSATIYARANTAACKVEYIVIEL